MNINSQILNKQLIEVMNLKKNTIIVKAINSNALDFYIGNEVTKRICFKDIPNNDFWEFVYEEILKVTDPVIDILLIDAPGNSYQSVLMELNEYVKVLVVNRNHQYDNWIDNLKDKKEEKNRQKIKKLV